MNTSVGKKIVTVTLNPALDQTIYFNTFEVGQLNRVERQRIDPGGKGINVAKVIQALGHSVCVTGFLGQDNSHGFSEYFARQGIENHFVEVAGAARVNIKIVDDASGAVTEINFPGLDCHETAVNRLEQVVKNLAQEGQWFVIAGSLPQGVADAYYSRLISLLKSQGARVFLDSSGRALREGIKALPCAIKPNLEELEQLLERPLVKEADIVAAVDDLLAGGIRQVLVTLGARGALVADKTGKMLVRPPVVAASSTVGAGDAMVAGFVAGQTQGLPLAACARLGTAAATASVVQPGTQAGSMREVERILTQVSVSGDITGFLA